MSSSASCGPKLICSLVPAPAVATPSRHVTSSNELTGFYKQQVTATAYCFHTGKVLCTAGIMADFSPLIWLGVGSAASPPDGEFLPPQPVLFGILGRAPLD